MAASGMINYLPARLAISSLPVIIKTTHISLNSFHKTLNNNPCNPLVNNLVGKPLPNNANTPSAAMISLAAVTVHQRCDIPTRMVRTVSNVLLVNLPIRLDYPQ